MEMEMEMKLGKKIEIKLNVVRLEGAGRYTCIPLWREWGRKKG